MNKASGLDRMLAGIVDFVVAILVAALLGTILPGFGLGLGLLLGYSYMLFRDCLPFLKGQSAGKQLLKIKVVYIENGADMIEKYGDGISRNMSLVIPLFNVVDAILVFGPDGRFGDKWAKTKVIKLEE